MTRAAFLDHDGVLVDSMPAHVKAWKMMLQEIGIEEDELLFYLREGEKAEDTIAYVLEKHGRLSTPEERLALVERKRELYRGTAPHGLKPEANELIQALRQRQVQCLIVTGSNRRNVDRTITRDQQALFATIITADDYQRGKPEPDPYLAALMKSGFAPAECRVLENAPLGVRAAKAAGITTIAIKSTLPVEYLSEADYIIEHYLEFLNYL
jgi:beta-phosphoglucomutase